ncbi:hypothetical protein [Frateuria terrea]|uniref:Cytochrome oxidase Cu insertion factor, SCO1/SenC/PrrC family n=1 Tax=Frateuria terrea TaxID=529704 RepID=A0A1H6X7F4_9GAMM|nr:hypothetical protein [Frateuria terrea]SEJ20830.1 hypothetical protein SAMN04487997_2723 [Frateuria terrea]SFP57994.1 hypothetical protein SAMN02927913_2700 [Frateuria terrea]
MNAPAPSNLKASRMKLLAIMAVFAAPIIVAGILTFSGWQPGGKGYGRPVEPQRNFVDEHVHVSLADGGSDYAWRDPAAPRMTLVALAGPGCAARCFESLTGMAKAWVTLNRNQKRLRLLYIGTPPADPAQVSAMKSFWVLGRDAEGKLDVFRPSAPDSVSALLVESNGTALAYYPAGFDGTGLLRDMHKVIK